MTFDEPENHLHPSMQKSFLPNVIAAFPSVQIIAVTHSPFIISALQDSAVYVLRYEDTEDVTREIKLWFGPDEIVFEPLYPTKIITFKEEKKRVWA